MVKQRKEQSAGKLRLLVMNVVLKRCAVMEFNLVSASRAASGTQAVLMPTSMWAVQQKVSSWKTMCLYRRVREEASNTDVS